jgi:tetratricopeptide (TPR) repeat protein
MDDCIACHMPRRRPQDVVHVVVTDHRIAIPGAPSESLLAPLAESPPAVGHATLYRTAQGAATSKEDELMLGIAGAQHGGVAEVARLRAMIEAEAPAAYEPYAHLAASQIRLGLDADAAATLRTMTDRFPGVSLGFTELGRVLQRMGDAAGAAAVFEKAIDLQPGLPENHLGLGSAWFNLGRIEASLGHLEEAVRLRPLFVDGLVALGRVRRYRGDGAGAAEALRRAVAAKPGRADALLELVAAELDVDEPDAAMRAVEEAERTLAGVAGTTAGLGEARAAALLALGRVEEALSAAGEAHQRVGADEAACVLVAAIGRHEQGEGAIAREAYAAALGAAQQQPYGVPVRAWLLRRARAAFEEPVPRR